MVRQLKDAVKITLISCVMILAVEFVLRIGASGWHNWSPYYLFYGVHDWIGRVGVNPMSTFQGESYKFPPHYVLRGAAGQETETATINSRGFRGPDFQAEKASGVFRVICLGESSTFGFRDGDQETYPFFLQKLFTQENLHAEVINAGFPYYNSGSILSLFTHELLEYDPDLITLYAGYNDTSWPIHIGWTGHLALWVQSHSITFLLLKDGIGDFVERVERKVFQYVIPQTLPAAQFQRDNDLVANRYRANLRSIIRAARSHNVAVVLIKQPVTTHNGDYLSLSYETENRRIREKLEKGFLLSEIETYMLKQHRLMEELDHIAIEESLPVVDNIKIVDQDRRRLASWVHLTAEANQRLAQALELVIKPYALQVSAPTVFQSEPRADSTGKRSGSN
jgi:lysophospholipase L1-like esterase